jgi:predicted XRE-type DNA-binding protein
MRIGEQLKQQLGHELRDILSEWTPGEAVARMGVRPSRISELRHGKLTGLSIARLLELIALQGYDVELTLRERKAVPRTMYRPTARVAIATLAGVLK